MSKPERKRENSVLTTQELPGKGTGGAMIIRFKVLIEKKEDSLIEEVLDFDLGRVAKELRPMAEVHGWKQRLGDKAALAKDTKTGKSATPRQKFQAIKELADHYMSGTLEWRMNGSGQGGGNLGVAAQEAQLLKQVFGLLKADKTPEEIHLFVSKLTKEQVKAFLLREDYKEAISMCLSEEIGAIDTDELLADF